MTTIPFTNNSINILNLISKIKKFFKNSKRLYLLKKIYILYSGMFLNVPKILKSKKYLKYKKTYFNTLHTCNRKTYNSTFILINGNKSTTPLSITVEKYVIKRTMFNSVKNTIVRVCNKSDSGAMLERKYADIAGKSKITSNPFSKNENKFVISPHQQLITDFNLIYENPKDIRLYQIGTLFTKVTKDSYNISNEKNYKSEEATQQIKFFKTPLQITHDVHIVKNSKKYFDDPAIREKTESNKEFKKMFDSVLEELKTNNIKVKVAKTPEEREETGFNVLTKITPPQDKNSLLETLPIKQHEKPKQ